VSRAGVRTVRTILATALVATVVTATGPPAGAVTPWPGPPPHQVLPNDQADPKCPAGHHCTGVYVRCNWSGTWRTLRAWYAEDDRNPATPRGMVVFLSGGEGTGYNWSNTPQSVPFRTALINAGLAIVHVRWYAAWNIAPSGDRAGMANVACRPVALLDRIYTQEYVPLNITTPTGECGFCVVGNSDGADALAYALTHYGPDTTLKLAIDAVVPVSGPQQAAMRAGCLNQAGYQWDASHLIDIDESYGYRYTVGDPNPPPCYRHDTSPAWKDGRWVQDGVESGGTDYDYPETRIHLILGTVDKTTIRNHARAWETVLEAAAPALCDFQSTTTGSRCREEFVAAMDVKIRSDPEGLNAVRLALVWTA